MTLSFFKGPTFAAVQGAFLPAAEQGAAAADQRLIEALADYIPHVMRLNGTPGLNLAVARRGRVIWEHGFGFADLAQRTPMTAATVAHSGSMAKVYTSVAALQLVERGALQLDAPINAYLTDFRIENPFGKRDITLEDLLTHRSGLNGNAAGATYRHPAPLKDHVREGYAKETFRSYRGSWRKRWLGEVGGQFTYSNFGMATVGYLVEIMNPERLSFSDYVYRNIIAPLGMTSTQFPPVQAPPHVRDEIAARYSTGYAMFGHVVLPTPTIYFGDFPAGTVVTTPGDHIRLIMALANQGRFGDCQLLEPQTVANMLTPHTDVPTSVVTNEPVKFGLGLQVCAFDKPGFWFGHGGAHMWGWVNNFRAFPRLDFAYAVFTNHWTILPARVAESLMIEDFIKTWIGNEIGGTPVDRSPAGAEWAWKTSYAIGVVFTEHLMGVLGIEEALPAGVVEAMAQDAKLYLEAANVGAGWDPGGFRAGMLDMANVPMTLEGIRAAVSSGQLRLTPQEFEKIGREFGLAGSPILMFAAQT